MIWFVYIFVVGRMGGLDFIVASLISGVLVRIAGRLRAESATDAIERTGKLPILLLRSFGADKLNLYEMMAPGPVPFISDYQVSFVKRLSKRTSRPVLAVGSPGNVQRSFRSPLVYVPDAAWQQVVTELMTLCPGIVVLMGTSKGLRWEITEAVRLVPPTRLVIAFGMLNAYERTIACLNLQDCLPRPLIFPKSVHFLSFSVDWHPSFSKSMPGLDAWK